MNKDSGNKDELYALHAVRPKLNDSIDEPTTKDGVHIIQLSYYFKQVLLSFSISFSMQVKLLMFTILYHILTSIRGFVKLDHKMINKKYQVERCLWLNWQW